MSWLSNLFGQGEFTQEVAVEAETDAASLEAGIRKLDAMYPADKYEETHEKDFYCGICGWVPISQFPTHGH